MCFLQLVCEVLALKNDIGAWRKKKSVVGISRMSSEQLNMILHTDNLDSITLFTAWEQKALLHFFLTGLLSLVVLWRCLCSLLIFLHLLEETSLLVLLPVGLGACTEVFRGIFSLLRENQRK